MNERQLKVLQNKYNNKSRNISSSFDYISGHGSGKISL